MNELSARVERMLVELGVEPDVPIGVACSGGADSVALVHLLVGRQNLNVLHVDHRMRPDSSSDAEFVRATAASLGCGSDARRLEDVPPTEGSAREMRYAALGDMARELDLRHVLTAHTSDDQAETVLLRLMRGDTLDSIAPVRGIFVRPLLDVTRAELRTWLRANDIAWREDPTNEDTRLERNWVRHVLLPQLRERRPGVGAVLARTAGRARDDALALDAIAHEIVSDAASDDVGIFVAGVDGLPSAIRTRVIRGACRLVGFDPTTHEVDAIATMGGHVRSGSVDAWCLDDGVAFTRAPFATPDPVVVPADGVLHTEAWGVTLRAAPGLRVRSRRPGDRVAMRAGSRKVSDVLVDAKVPRFLRPLVPILADEDGAVAVVGGRVRSGRRGGSGGLPPVLMGAEPFRQTWSRQRAWIS